MPAEPHLARLLDRVRRLPQRDEAWEGSARHARTWITPRSGAPYRPYLVIFVTADAGKILDTKLGDDPPTPELIFEELLRAMRRPTLGAGAARRPGVVYLPDAGQVAALTPLLAQVGVRCQHRTSLPMLTEALYSLERSMNRGKPVPGLLTLPGVTPPFVGRLYELAAEFYELAPWRWLNDQHPFEIRYPPEAEPRYAVVMGSGGEVFGLAVYDTPSDLQMMFADMPDKERYRLRTWVVLFFEEAMGTSFDDLDAIERFGWPVFAEHAYPVFGRTTHKAELDTPRPADAFWMEGALAAISAFVRDHLQVRPGYVRPVELTLPIATISGAAQVYLRVPAL